MQICGIKKCSSVFFSGICEFFPKNTVVFVEGGNYEYHPPELLEVKGTLKMYRQIIVTFQPLFMVASRTHCYYSVG